jgi:hypothetical protein
MTSFHLTGEALCKCMERTEQKVRERLERTAAALEQADIPYAIIGGHAVRAWLGAKGSNPFGIGSRLAGENKTPGNADTHPAAAR